jgi:hypothetical protein
VQNPGDSHILAFYRGQRPDTEGRMIFEIRSFSHGALEVTHDYIQWLFPMRTRSQFNPDAPVLDEATIYAFLTDEGLRAELLASFRVLLDFYGFRLEAPRGGDVTVVRSRAWDERSRGWLTPHNHNFLRITRILACLSTLGLPAHAQAFFAALKDVYESEAANVIGRQTYAFWAAAAAVGGASPSRGGRG